MSEVHEAVSFDEGADIIVIEVMGPMVIEALITESGGFVFDEEVFWASHVAICEATFDIFGSQSEDNRMVDGEGC
jgi:hypothetical protein